MKKISKIIVYYNDGTYEECNYEAPKYVPPPAFGPIPGMPYQPIPTPSWPAFDQTITCKMPDGTTREIKLDSPIVAQTNDVGRN